MAYDRLVIRDLGSSNGVRVNGRLVDEAQLGPGDEVAIAHFLYRLVGEMPAGRSTPARDADRPPDELPGPEIDLSDDFIPLDD